MPLANYGSDRSYTPSDPNQEFDQDIMAEAYRKEQLMTPLAKRAPFLKEHSTNGTQHTSKTDGKPTVSALPAKELFPQGGQAFPCRLDLAAEEISSARCVTEHQSMVVYVKMHMVVSYGLAIYLVGSCQELGNWNVREAVRLEWNQGDVWRGSTFVRGAADIEYKYVLADYSNPEPSSLVWEQGCNRKICMQEVENDEIYLNQKWNHEKITLEIITEDAQQVYVLGNAVELGLWTSKRFMHDYRLENKQQRLWSLTFHVEKQKDLLHYYYIKETAGLVVRERQPGRYLRLSPDLLVPENFAERVSVIRKPGDIRVTDTDSFKEFKISEITPELYVGSYVRSEEEIRDLANRNIRAVLNLQSKQDMRRYGVEWAALSELYCKHGIQAVNIQITDRHNRDFVNKCDRALRLLAYLVEHYGRVYVHCTAGIYRSPQLIVLFLVDCRGVALSAALNLLKCKRPFVRPSVECLVQCLHHLDSEKENIESLTLI